VAGADLLELSATEARVDLPRLARPVGHDAERWVTLGLGVLGHREVVAVARVGDDEADPAAHEARRRRRAQRLVNLVGVLALGLRQERAGLVHDPGDDVVALVGLVLRVAREAANVARELDPAVVDLDLRLARIRVAVETPGLVDLELFAQPAPAEHALLQLLEEDLLGLVGVVGDVDHVDRLTTPELEVALRVTQAEQDVDEVADDDRAEVVLARPLAPEQHGDLELASRALDTRLGVDALRVIAQQSVHRKLLERVERRQAKVILGRDELGKRHGDLAPVGAVVVDAERVGKLNVYGVREVLEEGGRIHARLTM
jgi:hypothetical protein